MKFRASLGFGLSGVMLLFGAAIWTLGKGQSAFSPAGDYGLTKAGFAIAVVSTVCLVFCSIAVAVNSRRQIVGSRDRMQELYRDLAEYLPPDQRLVRPAQPVGNEETLLRTAQDARTPDEQLLRVTPGGECGEPHTSDA